METNNDNNLEQELKQYSEPVEEKKEVPILEQPKDEPEDYDKDEFNPIHTTDLFEVAIESDMEII